MENDVYGRLRGLPREAWQQRVSLRMVSLKLFAARICGGKDSRCGRSTAKLLEMQKPNYQFEKRRKEQDKKAKKEEKRRLKLASSQVAAGNNAAPSVPVKPV